MRSSQLRGRSSSQRGLTLIELTISIGIIAVITVISYSVLQGSAAVASEAEARSDLDKMGRNAMRIMTRELSQSFISQNQTEHFKTVFKDTDTTSGPLPVTKAQLLVESWSADKESGTVMDVMVWWWARDDG